MAIPSVMQGLIELEDGKVFELDSARGATWLESIGSFRFEPSAANKPYTVRKETGKGGDYWYGYRKQNGKLHKKYIGKSSEVSTAKLEEIAEALNTPPQSRVTEVTDRVKDRVTQGVTEQVTDTRDANIPTALELRVQALEESLEAIREELRGKSDAGNFEELPTVTDSGLQIELSNLKAENETLRQELAEVKRYYLDMLQRSVHRVEGLLKENETLKADYAKLLEFSTAVKASREKEIAELRSQLETEKTRLKELDDQCEDYEKWWKEEGGKVADRDKIIAELRSELANLKQKSAPIAIELPDADDLLNRLKAKRKKSTASLADVEKILEILEG